MTGTEQTANLAGTVAQTFADLAADMMRVSASAWSPAPASAPHPGRSWYRAPAPNPFDLDAVDTVDVGHAVRTRPDAVGNVLVFSHALVGNRGLRQHYGDV